MLIARLTGRVKTTTYLTKWLKMFSAQLWSTRAFSVRGKLLTILEQSMYWQYLGARPSHPCQKAISFTYTSLLYPWEGRSRAGFSEILMAPCMAASSPFPPSPRRAGPKHSGRLMSSLTTTLAFSSTLSPKKKRHYFLLMGKDDPRIYF